MACLARSGAVALQPACRAGAISRRSCVRVAAKQTYKGTKESKKAAAAAPASTDVGAAGTAAIAAGLLANPIMLWSEWTLKTTGSGLPPGPGGLLGAAEGVSYLVVVGIIAWSIYTKATTGSGLPAGPSGLLGAVEGVSYLSLLGAIVVFGLTLLEKGSVPGPLG